MSRQCTDMLVAQETVMKKKQSLNLGQPDRAQYRSSPICISVEQPGLLCKLSFFCYQAGRNVIITLTPGSVNHAGHAQHDSNHARQPKLKIWRKQRLGPWTGAHQASAVFYNQVFFGYDPSSATSLLSSVTSYTTRGYQKHARKRRLENLKLLRI